MLEKKLIIEENIIDPYDCPYRACYTLDAGTHRYAPFSVYLCSHPDSMRIENYALKSERLQCCSQESDHEFPAGCPLKSVVKLLKFTNENWLRHIGVSSNEIYTVRDEPKSDIGGLLILPDGELWRTVDIVATNELDSGCRKFYELEGFTSWEELRDEIHKIYPNANTYYWHKLVKI